MSEGADWKQKYRDSLLEIEAEEKRWRQVEQILRRLVGRLCAAGMGVNAQLDDELIALAAANRRNAPAEELARLSDSLSSTVAAVDAVAPVPTVTFSAAEQSRLALKLLLESLPSGESDAPAKALRAELAAAKSDAALAAIIRRAAEVLRAHLEQLAGERARTAAVLSQVTERLEEMAGMLSESSRASRLSFDDTRAHNDAIISQMRELTREAASATELALLQSLVNARLERVALEVGEFRSREERRQQELSGRADKMRSRIQDLEKETHELHSKLADEQHGARLDPLTGLANRKSFDERLAREIAAAASAPLPAVLLLWDIDNFKFINDSWTPCRRQGAAKRGGMPAGCGARQRLRGADRRRGICDVAEQRRLAQGDADRRSGA